jgi:hypothetical protein
MLSSSSKSPAGNGYMSPKKIFVIAWMVLGFATIAGAIAVSFSPQPASAVTNTD